MNGNVRRADLPYAIGILPRGPTPSELKAEKPFESLMAHRRLDRLEGARP